MSDFATHAIMGYGTGYDARTLGAFLGGSASSGASSVSHLETMHLSHIEGHGTRRPDVDRLLVEFQNILAREMLKTMRASIAPSGLFGESAGREIFESLLDGEYARSIGEERNGLGLTETLKLQLGLASAPSEGPNALAPPPAGGGRGDTICSS